MIERLFQLSLLVAIATFCVVTSTTPTPSTTTVATNSDSTSGSSSHSSSSEPAASGASTPASPGNTTTSGSQDSSAASVATGGSTASPGSASDLTSSGSPDASSTPVATGGSTATPGSTSGGTSSGSSDASSTSVATGGSTATPGSTADPNTSGPSGTHSSSAPTGTESSASPGAGSTTDGVTGETSDATSTPQPTSTTLAPTTTTTPPTKFPSKTPEGMFVLTLRFGSTNASAIYCDDNCTYDTVSSHITTAFKDLRGFLYVEEKHDTANRRKRSSHPTTAFTAEVRFLAKVVSTLNETERKSEISQALVRLDNVAFIYVPPEAQQQLADEFFILSSSLCNATEACPTGYTCNVKTELCNHLCETVDCGNHGHCQVTVDTTQGQASSACICDSTDDKTYKGDRCEDSEISQKKVASILGGVLGTCCILLLIALIVMCVRMRNPSSSATKYQLDSGYSNAAYSDIDMKKM